PTRPRSHSCSTAIAVNVLVTDPIRNTVSWVTGVFDAMSASPCAAKEARDPSRTTPAARPTHGHRQAISRTRTSRLTSVMATSFTRWRRARRHRPRHTSTLPYRRRRTPGRWARRQRPNVPGRGRDAARRLGMEAGSEADGTLDRRRSDHAVAGPVVAPGDRRPGHPRRHAPARRGWSGTDRGRTGGGGKPAAPGAPVAPTVVHTPAWPGRSTVDRRPGVRHRPARPHRPAPGTGRRGG